MWVKHPIDIGIVIVGHLPPPPPLDFSPSLAAELLGDPRVLAAAALAFGVACLSALVALYVPLLRGFWAGCQQGGRGTSLGQNAYVLMSNYVAEGGALNQASGLVEYSLARRQMCIAAQSEARSGVCGGQSVVALLALLLARPI